MLLRMLVLGNHIMVFISSVIVTGLVSHFLHHYSYRSAHLVFTEVIATITLAFYLFGMLLPLIGSYRGYLMPMNLAMSYLWLTSFIFAAQDWSAGRCVYGPPGVGSCRKKHTVEAFTFITFFFLLCNTLAEAMLWRSHRTDVVTKNGTSRGVDNSANVV